MQLKKRGKSFETMKDNETLQKQWDKDLNSETIKKIKTILRSHFIFFSLSESLLLKVIEDMFYCEIEAGQYVF